MKIWSKKLKLVHFKNLNFNQKIISVILIVIVIGIISNVFPGNIVTGMASNVIEGPLSLLKGLLSGVDDLVLTIFGKFFPGEGRKEIYTRVILFSFIAGFIFFILGLVTNNIFLKLIVGIGAGYLFTVRIPLEVIIGTEILYSSITIIAILSGALILFWLAAQKLQKSKMGYILRTIIFGIMLFLIFSINNFLDTSNVWSSRIFLVLLLWVGGSFLWSFFKIFTAKEGETYEAETVGNMAKAIRLDRLRFLAEASKRSLNSGKSWFKDLFKGKGSGKGGGGILKQNMG